MSDQIGEDRYLREQNPVAFFVFLAVAVVTYSILVEIVKAKLVRSFLLKA